MHEFFSWLLLHRLNTVVDVFARRYAIVLPATGERDELRAALQAQLEAEGADSAHVSWEMTVFDVAWDMYQPPCTWRGCTELTAATSPLCTAHELEELL